MSASIRLTEAAADVIRLEATDQLRFVIGERPSWLGQEGGAKLTERLIQLADVLGALAQLEFAEHDATAAVEFTDGSLVWLKRAAKESRENLEQLDLAGEADVELAGRDAYLLWVAERIVRETASGEAIK